MGIVTFICYYGNITRAHKRERERVTYASATIQAESKTTTIKRTILEIAHCCMCMECSLNVTMVLFIVVVLDSTRTVADGSYTLSCNIIMW